MSNELAVIEISDDLAPTLYVENGLDQFLAQIQKQVNEVPDLTTKKGRDRIASLAAQVSRSKTAVEKPGREFLKRLKEQPKVVEAELRRFVTECDRIRDETRRPLTEWEEAENARTEALKQRLVNLRALADVIDDNGNYLPSADIQARIDEAKAVQLDDSWKETAAEAGVAKDATLQRLETALATATKREQEAAELDRLRKEQEAEAQRQHEEKLKREAAEEATRQAELKAQQERDASAQRERDLQQRTENAEREAREAQERTTRLAQEAREQAERDKQAAVEAERQRAADVEQKRLAEEKRIADEAAARARDTEHRRVINQQAVTDLVAAGIPAEQAKLCISAIVLKKVSAVTITY